MIRDIPIIALTATAPERVRKDIRKSLYFKKFFEFEGQLFRKNLSSFVVSVKEFEHPINRAMTVDQSTLRPLDLSMLSCRTQDCKIFVHDAGQFYWGSLASWLSDTGILESEPVPFKINSAEGVDVDTMDDWLLLNALIQYREGKNESTK